MDPRIFHSPAPTRLPLPLAGVHPMVDIPFVAGIDGRQFIGLRLSLAAAEIKGLMDPALKGATRVVRLSFPFKGFAVTLDVLAEIRTVDCVKGNATITFTEPGGAHLPQMRHVLNSYIAADYVGLGDVIAVGAIKPSWAKRAAHRGLASGQGQMAGLKILRKPVFTRDVARRANAFGAWARGIIQSWS